MKAFHCPHTRAINPLKEFTSRVVPSLEQIKPTPPLEPSLKKLAIRLVNIGKANLVVDIVVEDIMAIRISGSKLRGYFHCGQ
jgi:hypothetical protein